MRDVKKGENSGGVTAPLLSKVEACLVISLAAILILFMAIDALCAGAVKNTTIRGIIEL